MLRRISALAGAFVALSLTSCGGTTHKKTGTSLLHSNPNVVAVVGDSPVTTGEVRYWMGMFVGEDAYENARLVVPRTLVSYPPNLPACAAGMKAIVKGGPKPVSARRLETMCEELAADIKEQATAYIVFNTRLINETAELGIHVSNSDVQATFIRENAREFPDHHSFIRFLAQRNWTADVDKYLFKTDILEDRLRKLLQQKYPTPAVYASHVLALNRAWQRRTVCRTGFVVSGCEGFKLRPPVRKAASVLFEELAELAPEKKIRLAKDLNCKNSGKGYSCEKIF